MPTREADAERMRRLEAAIQRLSENVSALSTSLALIGEISERQSHLETKAALTARQAAEIAKTAVNKELLNKEILTIEQANRRRYISIGLVVLVLLALIAYTRYESVQQISSRLEANYSLCTSANDHIQYEINLISKSPGDPAKVKDAVDGLRHLKRNCDALFGPQNSPSFFEGL